MMVYYYEPQVHINTPGYKIPLSDIIFSRITTTTLVLLDISGNDKVRYPFIGKAGNGGNGANWAFYPIRA